MARREHAVERFQPHRRERGLRERERQSEAGLMGSERERQNEAGLMNVKTLLTEPGPRACDGCFTKDTFISCRRGNAYEKGTVLEEKCENTRDS